MPFIFTQAPVCPISRDQPLPAMSGRRIRTLLPHVFDLKSALIVSNYAKDIVSQLTVNNTRVQSSSSGPPNKRTKTRWKELTEKRVKRRYKYYAKNDDGTKDKSVWVETERIERMVWHDRGWGATLVFEYGDKGDEGEPVGGAAPVASGSEE